MRLISSTEQRTIELAATKLGLQIADMIGSAGAAAYNYIAQEKTVAGLAVVVLCGRGGNGADGFIVAKKLIEAEAKPIIVLCCGTPTGEAPQEAYGKAIEAGVPVLDIDMEYEQTISLLDEATLVVDAVFGLGYKGELPHRISSVFEHVNQSKAWVASIDIPSGVDADTGMAAHNTIIADVTLYVIGKKPAHIFKSSKKYCGKLAYLDIGIPQDAYNSVLNVTRELTPEIAAALLPERDETFHKWKFGSVVCIAGSDRYRGAAVLCARGALAGGAGLISVASTNKILDAVAAHCPEVLLFDLEHDKDGVEAAFQKATAFVVGCGMMSEAADVMTAKVLEQAECPVVVDAEGINAIGRNADVFKRHQQPLVITPHVGEFAKLIDSDADTVYQNRIRYARDFATVSKTVVVLKSENTIVALPNSDVYINIVGNSGLAKGGSGDLLSGLIGSLCAVGVTTEQAALLGVYLHSRASDLSIQFKPKQSLTPSAVAGYIPDAIMELIEIKRER
jgi:yjeF C-terminal region, hydroxyethylthiazole kinase-related/yjeF N-terminal region